MNEEFIGNDRQGDDDVNDKFVANDDMNDNVVKDDANVEVEGENVHDMFENGFNVDDVNFMNEDYLIGDDVDLYETTIQNDIADYTSGNGNKKGMVDKATVEYVQVNHEAS